MLDRRRFITSALAGAAAAPFLTTRRPAFAGTNGRFRLEPLPYPADFLAPRIDRETMEIHHGRHHAAYVNNLNAAMEGVEGPEEIERLIADLGALPRRIRTTVRNNGGGHANHALFWAVMTAPGESGEPSRDLLRAIERAFGSLEKFKERLAAQAMGLFGSGWAWLTVLPDRSLTCSATPNQDSPLMGEAWVETPGVPILGVDVWEHAYYITYRNRRAEYVQAFMELINWAEVSRRYEALL